ncbi:hypothetical protein D3C87_1552360 [compost metagenome]
MLNDQWVQEEVVEWQDRWDDLDAELIVLVGERGIAQPHGNSGRFSGGDVSVRDPLRHAHTTNIEQHGAGLEVGGFGSELGVQLLAQDECVGTNLTGQSTGENPGTDGQGVVGDQNRNLNTHGVLNGMEDNQRCLRTVAVLQFVFGVALAVFGEFTKQRHLVQLVELQAVVGEKAL